MPLTRPVARPALTAGLALGALLVAGVAAAGPAAALEDPRRPTATVTHGPSCGPAVVRVQVTNGTEPHRVALVFDGVEQQDVADLDPGQQAELVSEDVDWGVTVEVSVTVADPDGTVEQPLHFQTYTRPSEEDCEAVMPPPTPVTPTPDPSTPAPVPPTPTATPVPSTPPPSSSPPSPPEPSPPEPSSPAPSSPTPPPVASSPTPSPVPSSTTPWPRVPSAPLPTASDPGTSAPTTSSGAPSSTSTTEPDVGSGGPSRPNGDATWSPVASVSPGGVVTVRASGFLPGEPVDVRLAGDGELLDTVTAAADGSVEAVVQIPRGVALGAATLEFVGGESAATAEVDLEVAARAAPVTEQNGSPVVLAAGLALLTAAGSIGLVGVRRSRSGHSGGRR
ncbi:MULTISPECIES: hypothetical protein [unclassified Modestobacter]|uniref:hypothetical protein n=1 Tax=unclassified Modestobacter TaxID=2643866 RepID=UPI0022AB386F|nr:MULTISPECIES: hypothetical protein [unclassified Modestobacter]MCZ2825535.1 hypothetical protein [Modestobacter sp. VKM Ac-2981]MCZ2853400.1 hypothetical protein [Modestobacter sp. VKM Ac-2982]